MSLTIYSASARKIFNINNYLHYSNNADFEDYTDVLRTRFNRDREQMKAHYLQSVLGILKERNYDRDYSYLSVYTYALEGRTLEQISKDDLRILYDMLRYGSDELEPVSNRTKYFGLMLKNLKGMKNKYQELRGTEDYLTIFHYARENIGKKQPFHPEVQHEEAPEEVPPAPEGEHEEPLQASIIETEAVPPAPEVEHEEAPEEAPQEPVKPKDKRKRRNSYSGGKSFHDLLQEEVIKYNETHSIKRDIVEDICDYAINDREQNPEKYFDNEEEQDNFKRKYDSFKEQANNFGIMFMIPDDMNLFRDKHEQGMRNVQSLTRRDSQHEPLTDYIITDFTSMNDINRFIDNIYDSERYKPFKISVNVACIFERIVRTRYLCSICYKE